MRSSMNALLLIAALTTTTVAADKPNFSGNWTQNMEKSHFGAMPRPASSTLKITHAEPSLTMVTDVKGGFGGDEYSDQTYATDGTPIVFESHGAKVRSAVKWDGDAIMFHNDITSAEGFTFSSEATMTLLDGGKTLRQVVHVDAAAPVGTFDLVYIFDKR